METKLYKISEENFYTILAYYKIIKKESQKYFDYIIKYKKFARDYYLNLKQLFKEEENITNLDSVLNEKVTIAIDYSNKVVNNKNNLSYNVNNNLKKQKDINILPIKHNIDKINNFFKYQLESLKIFLNSMNNPLKSLYEIIEKTNSEITKIKNEYLSEKEVFLQKYSEFDSLNKKLKIEYYEAERKLVEYSLNKKSSNDIEKNKILENETNLKLMDIKKNQNIISEKFNNLGNFGKKFHDFTTEKINEIKAKTSSIFIEFEKCINMFLIFYKKSFFLSITQIQNLENEINKENEFDDLLKNNIKEIDEKSYNINFDEYQIKLIKKKKANKDKDISNTLKEFEIIEDEKIQLEEEDIFFIVKNMYKFDYINRNNYIINIEKEKLKIKEIIDKLIIYSDDESNNSEYLNKKNKNNMIIDDLYYNRNSISNSILNNNNSNKEEKITQEDIDYLCKLMHIKEYRMYFLYKFNKFRVKGAFKMPEDIFNYFIQIFKEITKYFYINEKNENNENNENILKDNNLDLETINGALILSQTFYCLKNDKRVYIQNDLSNEEIFHSEDFWKKMIKLNIEIEIEICKNNEKDVLKEENEDTIKTRRNNIGFAQIIPQISAMHGFGLNEEKIKSIILPLIDEFNINEINKKILFDVIENPNHI